MTDPFDLACVAVRSSGAAQGSATRSASFRASSCCASTATRCPTRGLTTSTSTVIGGEDEGHVVTTGILLGVNVRPARPDEIEPNSSRVE